MLPPPLFFRGDIFYEEELCLEVKETLIGSFCDGVVRIVGEAGRPVCYVVCELGVDEGVFGLWVRQGCVERAGGLSTDERAELVRLHRENATL